MKSVFLTLDVVVLWLAVVVQGDGDELAPMTWYKATQACRTHGELYHSGDKSHVGQFLGSNSGKHWIGAKVMYSSWTWTEDRSTLFTYVGYRNVTEKDKKVNKTFLYTNQAVRCYPECKPNATYIGLQGSKCFCLHSPKNTTENTAQNRCWGNSQESCGTAHGMSVYKVELLMTDRLEWNFGLNDICGYFNVTDCDDPVQGTVDTHTKKHCQEKKYESICNCTGEDPDDCEYTSEDKGDGSIDVPYTGRSGCVWAERLRNDTVVFGIKACGEKHKPLCTEDAISNKRSTSYSYSTSDQTPVPSTARNTDNYSISLSDTQTQPDGAVVGGSVAAAVVVILVLVLLAIIWMKRTKRVCFKDKSPDPDTRHVTSNQNIYELYDDHNVDSDYCNINDRPNQTDADALNNRNGRQHYEFELESAEAQLGVSGAKDEQYELAMDTRNVIADGEGDYDELHDSSHNKGQQWSGAVMYSHIHGRDGRGRYDRYDRTNSMKDIPPLDAAYSHIHSNRGVDDADTYDRAAPVEVVSAFDTTYSHVAPNTLGNE